MQLITKVSISSLITVMISSSFANTIHNLNESNLITIPQHSRSAAVNAEHAKECADMGGVDITDETPVTVGTGVKDATLCRITDNHKFNLIHPDINMKLRLHDDKFVIAIPPTGEVPQSIGSTFQINAYGQYNRTNMTSGILQARIPNDKDYMDDPCYGITTPVILGSGKYALILRCIVNSYGRQQSWAKFDVKGEVDESSDWIIHPNNPNYADPAKNTGKSDPVGCGNPSDFVGNPINVSIGNKFQDEVDIKGSGVYPLSFERYYNSANGSKWTNNYSASLKNYSVQTVITTNDNREITFLDKSGAYKPSASELGTLVKTGDRYEYKSVWSDKMVFNSEGKLIRTVSPVGIVHNISYTDNGMVVTDNFKHSLTIITNSKSQPLSVKDSDGTIVSYEYDAKDRLVKVTKNGKSRTYHYEDAKYPNALTGITDERGIRYVTWTYDANGRANSSYHIGDKDKVSIVYNSDTQTTLTNPLGRKYVYTFKAIDGVKRITAISGTATSSCPAIGTSYQYNDKALITLKTDGKGIKTSYDYNGNGQETTRTVGVGTSEATVIKTTWDDRFFGKPKTETYPDKVITYDYDNSGNLISQNVSSN